MDMFTGIDNEIVMDIKDYIRSRCGDSIADHIEFYISFYESVLSAYSSYDNLENDNATAFIEDVVSEL